MIKNKENSFFRIFHSLENSAETRRKRAQLKFSHMHFNKKARSLIAIGIIAIILVSVFIFLPKTANSKDPNVPQNSDSPTVSPSPGGSASTNTPTGVRTPIPTLVPSRASPPPTKPPSIISTAQTIDNVTWRKVAEKAWAFFQPSVGVDIITGLPYAGGVYFQAFTDWDLGVYIQATIDAQKIGLITTNGSWGSYDRLNKVLTFLETRDLNSTTHNPFWFYYATNGEKDWEMPDQATIDMVDTGRLFVALNNLRAYNPDWAQQINNIVFNQVANQVGNRTDYASLIPQIKSSGFASSDIYAYYIYSGFESFWPNDLHGLTAKIMNNLFSSGTVVSYNVSLPKSHLTCEPLLCAFFEFNNSDPQLTDLLRQVYFAHEAFYNATGNYVAFSEGSSFSSDFIYEWVVAPDGGTWKIQTSSQLGTASYTVMYPVIYCKVALSFLALYNSSYAKNMVIYLEQTLPDPTKGYYDGADNYGKIVTGVGSNTNGLILDAALYFIQSHPN
jgi:hypothetical protein